MPRKDHHPYLFVARGASSPQPAIAPTPTRVVRVPGKGHFYGKRAFTITLLCSTSNNILEMRAYDFADLAQLGIELPELSQERPAFTCSAPNADRAITISGVGVSGGAFEFKGNLRAMFTKSVPRFWTCEISCGQYTLVSMKPSYSQYLHEVLYPVHGDEQTQYESLINQR